MVDLILLNISKAFDTVPYNKLLFKLKMRFNNTIVRWIKGRLYIKWGYQIGTILFISFIRHIGIITRYLIMKFLHEHKVERY